MMQSRLGSSQPSVKTAQFVMTRNVPFVEVREQLLTDLFLQVRPWMTAAEMPAALNASDIVVACSTSTQNTTALRSNAWSR